VKLKNAHPIISFAKSLQENDLKSSFLFDLLVGLWGLQLSSSWEAAYTTL